MGVLGSCPLRSERSAVTRGTSNNQSFITNSKRNLAEFSNTYDEDVYQEYGAILPSRMINAGELSYRVATDPSFLQYDLLLKVKNALTVTIQILPESDGEYEKHMSKIAIFEV